MCFARDSSWLWPTVLPIARLPESKNQFAHHRPLEDAVRTRRIGGLGGPSSGQQATCRHAEGASPRDPASAAKAGGRQHALVLPETGERVGPEQVHGAADSSASATETAPTGTIYGQQRSGF